MENRSHSYFYSLNIWIEYDEIVLKLPNNRNIAFLSYDEYERHPEKLKKMNGYPTLYYYKKGEGLTILGE